MVGKKNTKVTQSQCDIRQLEIKNWVKVGNKQRNMDTIKSKSQNDTSWDTKPLALYDLTLLSKSFCSSVFLRFELASDFFSSSNFILFCLSLNPSVPLDFRLANLIQRLIRKFIGNSNFKLKKNSSKEYQWTLPFTSYPLLLRKFKAMRFRTSRIPPSTLRSLNSLSHTKDDRLRFTTRLNVSLRKKLMAFQQEGVLFALRRCGKAIIGDEMGAGKSVQALCVAQCYRDEWPLLVIAPASLRLLWAVEIEKWLPDILPSDILLLTSSNQIHDFSKKIVITSYTMLAMLSEKIFKQKFQVVIVDESHKMKACHRKEKLSSITKACIRVLSYCKRAVLLTGTPCITKPFNLFYQVNCLIPGLLGDTESFAKNYCNMTLTKKKGRLIADVSGGSRLDELRCLLNRSVLIRRLKEDILKDLPQLVRQVFLVDIEAKLKKRDENVEQIIARLEGEKVGEVPRDQLGNLRYDFSQRNSYEEVKQMTTEQKIGILKVEAVCGFIAQVLDGTDEKSKIVVFAHHKIVIKGIIQFVEDKNLSYMVIQGQVLPKERLECVRQFHRDNACRIAIVSITAGNVGFDLSCSSHCIFAELPMTQADLRQAESRLHRRNQVRAVNAYFAIAKNTCDQSRWRNLSRQLRHTSTLLNPKTEQLSIQAICGDKEKFKKTVNEKRVSRRQADLQRGEVRDSRERKIYFRHRSLSPIRRSPKRIFSMRIFRKNHWLRKFNKHCNQKTIRNLFVTVSPYSDSVYLFTGTNVNSYTGKKVDMSVVTNLQSNDGLPKLPLIISPLLNRKLFLALKGFCERWLQTSKVSQNKTIGKIIPTDYCFVKLRRAVIKKPVLIDNAPKRFLERSEFSLQKQPLDLSRLRLETAQYVVKSVFCFSRNLKEEKSPYR